MRTEPWWVLIADGDADHRMTLFRLLEHEGYSATVVDNRRQARALLATEPFDVVLIDLATFGPDGLEVPAIKPTRSSCHVPVIVMTERDDIRSIRRSLELGAVDYLAKPFEPLLVRARIKAALLETRLYDLESEHQEQLARVVAAADAVGGTSPESSVAKPSSGLPTVVGRALGDMAVRVRERERLLREELSVQRRQTGQCHHEARRGCAQ